MIVEPAAGDRVEDNLNPVGRAYYGFSTLLCTPASLSQERRAGARRPGRARRGSATSSPPPGSPASAAPPRRRSTSCSRRARDVCTTAREPEDSRRGARAARRVPRRRGLRRARRRADLLRGLRRRRADDAAPADLVDRALAVWKVQIPYLARHYRVVTFDRRGNGRSDRPRRRPARVRPRTQYAGRRASRCSTRPGSSGRVLVGRSRWAPSGRCCSPADTRAGRTASSHRPARAARSPAARAAPWYVVRASELDTGRGLGEVQPPLLAARLPPTSSSSSSRRCFPEPHSTKQIEDASAGRSRRRRDDPARHRRRVVSTTPATVRGRCARGSLPGAGHPRRPTTASRPADAGAWPWPTAAPSSSCSTAPATRRSPATRWRST